MSQINVQKTDVILPVSTADIDALIHNLPYLRKGFPDARIVIISNAGVRDKIHDKNVVFVDENTMIPGLSFAQVKEVLKKHGAESRTGWYFQQFLKMAYSQICPTEYYISWDADTIPLKRPLLFNEENKPCFSIKNEYHKPYFETLNNLLGYTKSIDGSFIAEHMVFHSGIMQELIEKIAQLDKEKVWFEIIIDKINNKDLPFSGFSEFETYGTYIMNCYPDMYNMRKIENFRHGRVYFAEIPEDGVLAWIGKKYETIAFEHSQVPKYNLGIYKYKWFRGVCSFDMYQLLCRIHFILSPQKR